MTAKYIKSVIETLRLAGHVSQKTGKGVIKQFSEIARLLRENPTCGVYDYYQYRMYDSTHVPVDTFGTFAGWKTGNDISLALNDRSAVAPAWDKMLITLLLDAYGFSGPVLKAIYKDSGLVPRNAPIHLESIDQLCQYLRRPENYPLYAKPVDSQQGIGGVLLKRFNERSDSALKSDDFELSVDDFVSQYIHNPNRKFYREEAGYLFQEPVQQHHEVSAFQGYSNVSGIRLVCIATARDGIVPVRAVWKLSLRNNSNDNFSRGKYGNMIAKIDLETGRPGNAVDGLWPHSKEYPAHPVTNRKFDEFVIPNWGRILEIAKLATAMTPKMLIQFWDIAIGPEGPIFIELNDLGGLEILQVHGEGVVNDRIRSLLQEKGKLKKGSALYRLLQ